MPKKAKVKFDATPAPATVTKAPPPEKAAEPEPQPKKTNTVLIEVPYMNGHVDGYVREFIQRMRITRYQGNALKRLCASLDEHGARMRDGKRVRTGSVIDAIRWLIEQVAEANEPGEC